MAIPSELKAKSHSAVMLFASLPTWHPCLWASHVDHISKTDANNKMVRHSWTGSWPLPPSPRLHIVHKPSNWQQRPTILFTFIIWRKILRQYRSRSNRVVDQCLNKCNGGHLQGCAARQSTTDGHICHNNSIETGQRHPIAMDHTLHVVGPSAKWKRISELFVLFAIESLARPGDHDFHLRGPFAHNRQQRWHIHNSCCFVYLVAKEMEEEEVDPAEWEWFLMESQRNPLFLPRKYRPTTSTTNTHTRTHFGRSHLYGIILFVFARDPTLHWCSAQHPPWIFVLFQIGLKLTERTAFRTVVEYIRSFHSLAFLIT